MESVSARSFIPVVDTLDELSVSYSWRRAYDRHALPTFRLRLPTSYFLLPTSYLLPTTYYLLPTTYYLLTFVL